VPGQFTIGPVIDACLFAHGLPANAILAVFTDASFEGHQHFSADHTFFLFFAHGDDFIPDGAPLPSFSIQHFDLFRILQDKLQSVSGMILDFSLQFHLFAFECLRLKLIFFEQVRR
jgi:hypothetical protein